MQQSEVIRATIAAHRRAFAADPQLGAWAPGRVEVLGNHTDYNEGTVLSAAIDLGHCLVGGVSDAPGIRLQAVDVDQVVTFDFGDATPGVGPGWSHYVKGVGYLLQQELGQPISGLDLTFLGSIPMGAGLSSSAALEVATALVLLQRANATLDRKRIAQLCRQAEHKFAGTNCGLLDQFSSLFGRAHGLIHSDFRDLSVTTIDLPHDIEFLVVNPQVAHRLSDSPYNERRQRCEQAARELDRWLPQRVTALRDVSPEDFAIYRTKIDPAASRRAAHVIGEMERVAQASDYIRAGDMPGLGQCLFASHASSIEHFENSCPELDAIVDAARLAGALGARLTGGGFGGSALVMVRQAAARQVEDSLNQALQAVGIHPVILTVTPSAGAHDLPLKR